MLQNKIPLVFFVFCIFRISYFSYFVLFVFRSFRISYFSYFVFCIFPILYLICIHEVSKKILFSKHEYRASNIEDVAYKIAGNIYSICGVRS